MILRSQGIGGGGGGGGGAFTASEGSMLPSPQGGPLELFPQVVFRFCPEARVWRPHACTCSSEWMYMKIQAIVEPLPQTKKIAEESRPLMWEL